MAEGRYLEGLPLPQADATTEPFWEGCAARELRIQKCSGCGAHRHVPAVLCSRCRSFDYGWDVSRGDGRIFSYIVVHHPVHPATEPALPYNVSVIELEDCGGVHVTSNVVGCANEGPARGHAGAPGLGAGRRRPLALPLRAPLNAPPRVSQRADQAPAMSLAAT